MSAAAVLLLLAGQVQVSIDAKRLNPSEPMLVRFTIENPGEAAVDVDEPQDWAAGLEIRDAKDKVLKVSGSTGSARKVRLEGRAFIGKSVNIAGAIAGAAFDEGHWRLTWKHAGATSVGIEVLVVRDYIVRIDTNRGEMSLELLPDNAPRNVLHFMGLVRKGFYDRKTFYRVIESFVIQGGDPKAKPVETVRGEFTDRKHMMGTMGMARGDDRDSAATEFYIALAPRPELDGKYSIIGQLVDGEKVLREIAQVRTDHSPCKGCGKENAPGPSPCCKTCHRDKPETDIVIKGITLTERK